MHKLSLKNAINIVFYCYALQSIFYKQRYDEMINDDLELEHNENKVALML